MTHCDVAIIGGGIVGVSTAWQLKKRHPEATIVLIEKEKALAGHQTGHNSGVIHAGVYYNPSSLKARFCKTGAAQIVSFCEKFGIPYEQCGKLLVATNRKEYDRMAGLEQRCIQNRIEVHRLKETELKRREPNISGLGALFVPATGITDYTEITAKMAELFVVRGGEIRTGAKVEAIHEHPDAIDLYYAGEKLSTGYLIVCGGLMADRLARMMHIDIDFQIVPFRGEYYRLSARHNRIVRHLIYPIPNPDLPFLGVHLTRMIDGSVTVGPNAVLGFKREGYGRFNLNLKDLADMLIFPGFWRVAGSHFRSGLAELRDSLLTSGYLERVQKYCPKVTGPDLLPYPAGVRAQAVGQGGGLIHDFLFAETRRSLHVCNAPSPAATSAIPIGNYICDKVDRAFQI